ncbi:hypothetical protein NSA50_17855 [Clostridium sp. DSM 100503]|uniref:hypothetical protein n=1 Tax=Clostridium sp. DSM 100503 TaxID=2963282 RepID=UPI002149F160|nr:hypothetical protein [Clostridium sp. DSM 100503]MCR1952869.1 hypothetical protein [Clostridium sp. DSM 100503]
MYFKTENYTNDMEILASPKNLVTFTATVLASNVTTADEHGRKYVPAGSFIDSTGVVVKASGDTFAGTPIGVLYKTVDVTDGDMPCSIIVEGYLREDRVLDGYSTAAKTAVKAKIPNIKFR